MSGRGPLDELRIPGDDRADVDRGVTYHEWPESPGSMTARQPIREAHRGNGAPARCDRRRAMTTLSDDGCGRPAGPG
jgi:hypothetical protein